MKNSLESKLQNDTKCSIEIHFRIRENSPAVQIPTASWKRVNDRNEKQGKFASGCDVHVKIIVDAAPIIDDPEFFISDLYKDQNKAV